MGFQEFLKPARDIPADLERARRFGAMAEEVRFVKIFFVSFHLYFVSILKCFSIS
jgi:hypothetical protein